MRVNPDEAIAWIEKRVCIQNPSPEGGTLPFVLNKGQRELARTKACTLDPGMITLTIKVRQGGSTTYTLALILYLICTRPGFSVIFMAPEDTMKGAVWEKWRIIWESVAEYDPDFPGVDQDNDYVFRLGNGSRVRWICAGRASKTAARTAIGETVQLAVLCEFGFWEYEDTTLASLVPTLRKAGGSILVDSTPPTKPNLGRKYLEFAKAALEGAPEYEVFFWPWYWDDTCRALTPVDELTEYEVALGIDRWQAAWRRAMLESKTEASTFFQNYPEDAKKALSSPKMVYFVSREIIERYDAIPPGKWPRYLTPQEVFALLPPGVKRRVWAGDPLCENTKVWHPPEPGKEYVIGVDPSQGLQHGDYQVYWVNDLYGNHCATTRIRVPTPQAAGVLQRLGEWFNHATIEIEQSGDGSGLVIYEWVTGVYPEEHVKQKRAYGCAKPYRGAVIKRSTTPLARSVRTTCAHEHVTEREVLDPDLIQEVKTLDIDTGRCIRKHGDHDDIWDACGIAYDLLQRMQQTAKLLERIKPSTNPIAKREQKPVPTDLQPRRRAPRPPRRLI